jgi:N-glycosylase/DNA lyase
MRNPAKMRWKFRESSRVAQIENTSAGWNRLECDTHPLNLSATLASGQAFRWRQDVRGVWWGAVGHTVLALWQRAGNPDAPLFWQTFPQRDQLSIVLQYLRLDVSLNSLYMEWTRAEPRIHEAVREFRGLRILRQPPEECFFAFQCATCNTVVKIERTIHRLASRYGDPIDIGLPTLAASNERVFPIDPPSLTAPLAIPTPLRAFPELDALAAADEQDLRSDLWGYRAPRVIALARELQKRGPKWLPELRNVSYAEAKAALVELHGIGEKVADCICLFSLDKDEAVPVDTHVRQIAYRLFEPDLENKSLTPRVYAAIADAYRQRFGAHAGWAQQYLFLGALRSPPGRACG